jgi:hypothetical protein
MQFGEGYAHLPDTKMSQADPWGGFQLAGTVLDGHVSALGNAYITACI